MHKAIKLVACTFAAAAVLFVGAAQAPAALAAGRVHVVASGDSMWRIARQYGVSLAGLQAANPAVSNPAMIYPGMKLTIPDKARTAVDPFAPSGGAYPTIRKGDNVWIDVSLNAQRVYIKKGATTVYTMVMSSGVDPTHSSPKGTFYVEPERGTWFFSEKYQEGAKYWVSWKGHGIYLFHSAVMDRSQQVIWPEAAKLGTKASHGCFRLTVADAKWIYEQIPTGTKVVVHD